MESLDTQTMETNRNVPASAISHIARTGKWMRILAIFGFIGIAFMLLIALIVFTADDNLNMAASQFMNTAAIGTVYLIMALLYLFPTMMLWQAGSAYKRYSANPSEEDIETGFMKQATLFQFIGILTIFFISIIFLMIIVGGGFLFANL